MRLQEVKKWKFNAEFYGLTGEQELREEFRCLSDLLGYIKSERKEICFEPIEDVPDEIGIELFLGQKKLAELYCAYDRDGRIPDCFAIHSIEDWNKCVHLKGEDTIRYLTEMLEVVTESEQDGELNSDRLRPSS